MTIPSHWQHKTLEDVSTVIAGQSPLGKNLNQSGDGTPFFQGKKDFGAKYLKEPSKWTTEVRKTAQANDILMSVRAPVGPVNVTKQNICIGRGLAAIRKKDDLDQEYLYLFLKKHETEIKGKVGAVFDSINQGQIKAIKIPVPPIEEQREIVQVLDSAFEKIDAALKNTRQNIINADELFQSKLTQIFSNPDPSWQTKTLSQLFDVRDGTHDSPKYIDEGYALVTSKNLKRGLLDKSKIKYISQVDYTNINKRSAVDVGDILFAMIGTIGSPVVVVDTPDYAIKNVALFKPKETSKSEFYAYYLGTQYVIKKMATDAKGTTQKFVGLGYLRSFPAPFVPEDEQNRVIALLNKLSEQTKTLSKKYQDEEESLLELKKSLLQKAFTGELTGKKV